MITERVAKIRIINAGPQSSAIAIAVATNIYLTDIVKIGYKLRGKLFCENCYKEIEDDTKVHSCGGTNFLRITAPELRDFHYEAAFTATDKFAGNKISMKEAVSRAKKFNEVYNDNRGSVSAIDLAAAVGISIEDSIELVLELIRTGYIVDNEWNFRHAGEYLELRKNGKLQRIEWWK